MNPQAFPSHHQNLLNGAPLEEMKGMDLRDYFAAKAMQGMLASPRHPSECDDRSIARVAYQLADAMLEARKK